MALGRDMGGTIQVVMDDGNQIRRYSGYLFRKKYY
jgi:hypothetical protein